MFICSKENTQLYSKKLVITFFFIQLRLLTIFGTLYNTKYKFTG